MNANDVTTRLERWADNLEDAARAKSPADGSARARLAMDVGVALYDEIASADPTTLPDPLDVLEAAGWLTGTRGLLCDGVATMVGPWANQARAARGGLVRIRRHVVRAGDTLQSIASMTMGDWREWARIADANDLDPAASLSIGAELIIPEPDRRAT